MTLACFDQQLHPIARGFDLKSQLHASIDKQSHNVWIIVGNEHLG